MYSHLIEKVSCIPSSCYVEKAPDLRPSEIISRIMRDDISFSYASRIREAYFPDESFEELFVEDNPDDCHLTAADVIRVMDKNPHFGMVVPDAVFSTIRGRVESIAPLYTCEGLCRALAWFYAAGVAEGKKCRDTNPIQATARRNKA